MSDERFDDDGTPVHEPLDLDGDNVLPLDDDGVSDPVDVPDQPIPVLPSDDPDPVDDVAVDDPEPVVDPEPAVDDVPSEVPDSPVDVKTDDKELSMDDIDPETKRRMAQLLRKRRNNSITHPQAVTLMEMDEDLFWEVYNMRTWH